MNNNYYRESTYSGNFIPQQPVTQTVNNNTIKDTENFLNMNLGKKARIYISFPDSIEWRDKIFEGTIESVGIDYVLIHDINSAPVLLQKIYINYIEFEDRINN